MTTAKRGEFSMGWKTLFAGVIGVACGASPIPYGVAGFLVVPLQAEFGWSVTQILTGVTMYGVMGALLAPLYGWMADRFGVRPVALGSLFAFGLAFAAIGMSPGSLTIFYLMWLVMGAVGMGSTPVTWSRAVNMWFFKNRGLALGILLLGTSLAAMVVPRLAVWAIETYGWRAMFPIVAALPLLVALPIGLLWFREPKPGEEPDAIKSASGKLTGVTLKTALRDYRFYVIWVSVVIIAVTFGGAYVNMAVILSDSGVSAQTAATVVGILGLGIFTGRIATGMLLDRFWAGFVGFPLLCLPAISSYLLIADDITFLAAAIAGFLLGFAAGAESDLIAYLAGRYFGMAHYGKIYGMLYMPFGLGSAVSPIIYAYVRDTTGTYDPILTVAIFAYLVGGGLLLLLGKYPELTEPDEPAEPVTQPA